MPDIVLAAWAGHTNTAFTEAEYVHVEVEDLRTAAAAWDAFHGAEPTGSENP
ncbi:hypothetical protein [Streptomyces sp. NBC_01618]|uniref:hypothetical protein n=1 Tax=Streptomyces sp. NBC_01618 TaxID=2975900 RepID=UPI00386836AB|nr:hypothetical protein OH735_04555 [Streptomyces sp. NBC_01618]